MTKKRYNWKARQPVETLVDNSDTQKIKLDLNVEGTYDDSNLLALPSKKRKTKIKHAKSESTRILSKKQRKRLEKIIERKDKKTKRAGLLEELAKVQASPEELEKLTSISSVQTKGLKRHFSEQQNANFEDFDFNFKEIGGVPSNNKVVVNSIKGAKRKRLMLLQKKDQEINDPNVVGFDSSSDSEDNSDTENEEVKSDKNSDADDNNMEESESAQNRDKKEEQKEEKKETEINRGSSQEKEAKESNTSSNANKEITEKDKRKEKCNQRGIERKPAIFVDVIRDPEIQKARLKLPILAEEQQIMEVINANPIIILAGETGSGKTTQVPQFLYEAGYALEKMIAITEPRRVAAISMSKRVAQEMSMTSKEISYLIRFEGNVTDETKIKFMTDGVLLKEVQTDFLLKKYSVVILDEAHERSVYTDILIGLLSRIVPLRIKKGIPLKLIIMSATLRVQDFTENVRLFKTTPPVINIDSRQFPVTIHFNKRTNENYLQEAFSKTSKIHKENPDGGILVFVTGQQEVNMLVKKLRNAFPFRNKHKTETENKREINDDNSEDESNNLKKRPRKKKTKIIPEINLDDYSLPGDNEDSEYEESNSDEEFETEISVVPTNSQPLWVLPLYSMLPSHKQAKVFESPPPGSRLCIVSTNVAETSLTIPNIKYVVDTGKTKAKLYDKITGVTSYMVTWTSKASASQRTGRAGRTGPGHCYRLYSSAVFNDVFQEYDTPEIQQKPVDDLYLQMKCMNIDKVANFPFPTAPDMLQLKMSESRLTTLGALKDSRVTPLGRAISKFPVLPRYGKMLALSHQHDLLPYTICLVAALSVQEVLLETPIGQVDSDEVKNVRQKWISLRRQWAGTGNSLLLGDAMVLLKAVGAAEYANSEGKLEKFCTENGLRYKAVVEIRKLRIQLTNEIKTNMREIDVIVNPKLNPPTDLHAKLLRQIMLSGMGDQVAKKITPDEIKDDKEKTKYKYAYHANNMEEPVYLHQGSVLRRSLPEYLIFQEIYETNKMYMRGVTAIEPEWLPVYVPNLCKLNRPLTEPEPFYDENSDKIFCYMTGTFGSQNWPISKVKVEYPETLEAYKWFSMFLLEGKVFNKLEKYKGILLSSPSIMVKTWAKLQPRTDGIMKMLAFKHARSRARLEELWKENPKFLLTEYLKWLPQSAYGEVSLMWPPI